MLELCAAHAVMSLSNGSAAIAAEGILKGSFSNLSNTNLDVLTTELCSRGVCTNTTDFPSANREDVMYALETQTSGVSRKIAEVNEVLLVLEATTGGHSISIEALDGCKQPSQVLGLQGSLLSEALSLLVLFSSVRDVLSEETDGSRIEQVKKVVSDYLKPMSNAHAQVMKKLEHKDTVKEVLDAVIDSGFCSYLDYKFLRRLTDVIFGKKVPQEFERFQAKHESFCKRVKLGELCKTLQTNPDFQISRSVVMPSFEFRLSGSWPLLRFQTATTMLTKILPWMSDLQLQAVESLEQSDDVVLVYSGHDQADNSLVCDLQNPDKAQCLRELSIFVQMRKPSQLAVFKVNTTDSEVQAVGHHDDDNEDLEKILAQIFDEVQRTREEMAEYLLGDSLLPVNLVKESGESDALVEKVSTVSGQMTLLRQQLKLIVDQCVDSNTKELLARLKQPNEEVSILREQADRRDQEMREILKTKEKLQIEMTDGVSRLHSRLTALKQELNAIKVETKKQLEIERRERESLLRSLQLHVCILQNQQSDTQATLPTTMVTPEAAVQSGNGMKTTLSSQGTCSLVLPESESFYIPCHSDAYKDPTELVVGLERIRIPEVVPIVTPAYRSQDQSLD